MARCPLLAKIHIAKKELRLDEENYRAVLKRVTNKDSAKDLSDIQKDKLLSEFRRMGWKAKKGTQSYRKKSTNPMVRKVFALWGDLGRQGILRNSSRQALRAYVKRMTGIEDPEWMDSQEAVKVIEGLKAMQSRAA